MSLKTVFLITVATYRMIFPGISPAHVSGTANDAVVPVSRSLTMDFWSDRKADAEPWAQVAVPEGLKLGSSVKLTIDQQPAEPESPSDASKQSVTKVYWGSAETIPAGQPKIAASTIPSDSSEAPAAAEALPASYAYWPPADAKRLASDAAAQGTYTLTTSYCGGTSVTLAKEQEFLDTVRLADVPKRIDPEKPFQVTWKTVPNAVGYILNAYGGDAKESISWTSSADPKASLGIEDRIVTREEATRLIEKNVLLPSYAVTCTIPAGVFKGSKNVLLTVTAIGADKTEVKDGIETRVMVRSTVSLPLNGTP